MRFRFVLVAAVALIFLFTSPAQAQEESVVPQGQVRSGPLVLTGQAVTVSGTVNGDLYVLARQVRIDGVVNGDLFIAAEKVSVNGTVTGDIRCFAVETTLSGSCQGSFSVLGDTLWIWREGNVGQGLYLNASSLQLNGSVGKGIRGECETAYINSQVGGPVDILAQKRLAVGPEAALNGALSYRSENKATIDEKARIVGNVRYTRVQPPKSRGFDTMRFLMGWWSSFILWWLISLVIPRLWRTWGQALVEKPGISMATGALTAFLLPAALFLLILSVVGMPAALILALTAAAAAYAGRIVVVVALSRYAMRNWQVSEPTAVLILLIPVVFVTNIPAFGFFFSGLYALLGLGSLVICIKGLRGAGAVTE